MNNNFKERFTEAIYRNRISLTQLSEITGINASMLSQYRNGKFFPKYDKVCILAKALKVDERWLAGLDDSIEQAKEQSEKDINKIIKEHSDLYVPITKSIPVIGKIACGSPIFSPNFYDDTIQIDNNITADFACRTQGDSMIDIDINNGDFVLFTKQDIVDNGQLAAVLIGEEVTLKRVFYYPQKSKLILQAANKRYEPMVYTNDELDEIRIIGRAVYHIRSIKNL